MTPEELKEFDNKIGNKLCYIGDRGQEHLKNIQDFINQLLKTRQEKMVEELEKSKQPIGDIQEGETDRFFNLLGFNQGIDKAIEIINR